MISIKTNTRPKAALTVAILTAIVFIVLFAYLGINQRKLIYNDSKQLAQEISRKAAIETEKYLSSALVVAQSMKSQILTVRELGGTRGNVRDILRNGLLHNTNFLATWTLWEPNAFDGRDNQFKTNSQYNSVGTLGVGFFNYKNTIFSEIMTPADYLGPHYLAPKDSLKDVITEPYRYVYSGYKQVFFGTTVSVPIIVDNKFLGAVGVDIDLKNLSDRLNCYRLYKSGFLSLITNQGKIVTHKDSTLINRNIFEIITSSNHSTYNSIVYGEESAIETISEFSGEKVFRFFYPISISNDIRPWSMMVEIPLKSASTRSKQVTIVAFGILLLGLVFITFLVFNLFDRKRYEKVIRDALKEVEIKSDLATESANNYMQIFNSTSEAIFIHDTITGEIVDVNNVMLQMYGYGSKYEIKNFTISNFSSNQGKFTEQEASKYIKEAFIKGVKIFEWQAKKKNGELFWVEVALRISKINGTSRILAVVRDITERKKVEDELRESQERYKILIETSHDGISLMDLNGVMLFVNRRKAEMVGISNSESLIGKNAFDLLTDESKTKITALMPNMLQQGFMENIEADVVRADGTTFTAEFNINVLKDSKGKPQYIMDTMRNITERKNALLSIEQSEKKFRELAELLPQVVWEADLNAKFTYTNKKGLDLFGYTQAEFDLGIGILDVVIPEQRAAAAENIKKLFYDVIIADAEYIGIKKDGTTFPIEIYSSVIYSEGKPVGLRGITIDITERKNSEKAISESEEKYRTLMESMNEVVIMADNNHVVHYVNRMFTEKLGYLPEEVIGKVGYKIFHDPEDFKLIEAANVDRIDKKVSTYELKFKTKDGRKIDFLVSGAPLFDSNGKTYGSIGSMMDISERKNIEKALRESEEKYRTLMEHINEVIMMVDNDDRVLFVNQKFTEKLGYTSDEILGKIGYEVLLAPNDKLKIVHANKERLSRKASQYEATFIAKNGNSIEFLVSGAPILNNDGITVGSIGAMMDITERKKAEKALHESQQLFETLAKMAPVGIFRTRADGYTTYVNPKWTELSGVSFDEALGDGWLRALHPEDRENINIGWKERTVNSEKSIAEYRFVKNDNSIVWVLGNALPEIVDGEVKGYIGTITNITDLKNAQAEIAKSEKKFREMANLLPQTIWEADINGNITYTNNNGYKYLGYSEEDMDKGLNLLSLIIPEDRDRALKNIQRRYNNEKSHGDEYVALRKDGSTYPVQIFTSPIIENGKPIGIRGISIDITESKKAQKEIQESEERYRTIIEAFPDIIMISDLNGKIIFANETLEQLTGITPADYDNPKRKAHIYPEDIHIVKNAIQDLISGKHNRTDLIENRFIDTQGNIHWFSGIMSKLVLNNQVFIQTITRDITEKKNIEKELEKHRNNLELLVKERTEELESALDNLREAQKKLVHSEKMASLGVLAAGIAHEINNPLNFIQGGISGLNSYIREILPEHLSETEPLINAVQEGIRRSSEIVQSLNRYSRKDEFPRTLCNVNSIIESCLVMLNSQTKNRIVVERQFSDDDLTILCNEGQIHQAFLNIIANAIHAIENHGNIKIITAKDSFYVKVSVFDDGCGISKENLTRIADPFFTTKDPGKGTGLGLSITYNIIAEHNGNIEFESELGHGTTVNVILPTNN